MAITQWDLHDSLCQGGPSSEQSDSGDCVDLTGNDESARPGGITKPEGVRIEHNPDCSLTDEMRQFQFVVEEISEAMTA